MNYGSVLIGWQSFSAKQWHRRPRTYSCMNVERRKMKAKPQIACSTRQYEYAGQVCLWSTIFKQNAKQFWEDQPINWMFRYFVVSEIDIKPKNQFSFFAQFALGNYFAISNIPSQNSGLFLEQHNFFGVKIFSRNIQYKVLKEKKSLRNANATERSICSVTENFMFSTAISSLGKMWWSLGLFHCFLWHFSFFIVSLWNPFAPETLQIK